MTAMRGTNESLARRCLRCISRHPLTSNQVALDVRSLSKRAQTTWLQVLLLPSPPHTLFPRCAWAMETQLLWLPSGTALLTGCWRARVWRSMSLLLPLLRYSGRAVHGSQRMMRLVDVVQSPSLSEIRSVRAELQLK